MVMIHFETLKQQLTLDEADRRKPYDDSTGLEVKTLPTGGNLTIGVGRNLFAKPLSDAVVNLMLKEDINEALDSCLKIFPGFEIYSQRRQHALINMVFNMGETRFRSFKKMIHAIHNQMWEAAGEEAKDSEWYTQVKPKRADPIIAALKSG